jgi:hypothetical protein
MPVNDGSWPLTLLPGDEPGKLKFVGSALAERFTRELAESLEGLLTHNLYPEGSAEPGFASASAPGRVCEGQCWTRDAGTLLRELVQWGWLGHAAMEARALMRLVRPNAAGFCSYPMYFVPGTPAAGDELDGTGNVVISLVLLWRRLAESDPLRRQIQDFLTAPSSPLFYFHHVLGASPLIPGHGEFGGGMWVDGLHMNVVQNGLCRLALLAGASVVEASGDGATARRHRAAATRLAENMAKYLTAPDGGWTWCVDPRTLRPDPTVLNAEANIGFGGINGVTCMQSDVLGFEPNGLDWHGLTQGTRTLERLAAESYRRDLFARYGMWPQFGFPHHDHLTSPSYGQGYAIQTMLLLDRLDEAERALTYLIEATYAPPEGYKVDRASQYWFYERMLAPEFPNIREFDQGCGALALVNVCEPLKVGRLIAGIDDTQADQVLIRPRIPGHWQGYQAENWPILAGWRLLRADVAVKRTNGQWELSLSVGGGGSIPRLAVQWDAKAARQVFANVRHLKTTASA